MIIKCIMVKDGKSYFDKAIKFQSTKSNYVNDNIKVGSVFDVKANDAGYYESPSVRSNKIS